MNSKNSLALLTPSIKKGIKQTKFSINGINIFHHIVFDGKFFLGFKNDAFLGKFAG